MFRAYLKKSSVRATTRHNLKRDQFAEAVTGRAAETMTWAQEHQGEMIAAGVAVVLVIAAAIGVWWWSSVQGDKANLALGEALRTQGAPLRPAGVAAQPGEPSFSTAAERAQAARKAFDDVAQKYPHTAPGSLARYFAAVTFVDEGKYSDAEAALKRAADAGNKDVAALANFALAQAYSAQHRDADAIRLYKDLADHPAPTVSKSAAQMALADYYGERGQPQEAVKIYQQIIKDEAKTVAAEAAQQHMAALTKK